MAGRRVPAPSKKFVFEVPDPDAPGFVRRQWETARHIANLNTPSAGNFDAALDHILQFVVEPEDRNEAREVLLDMNRTEWFKLLNALAQESENPLLS